jgi:predicted ArsR family transcriptional regulator
MASPDDPDDHARQEATPEELKALAHPLRLRILRLCLHEARTNKELADRLGKDPATVLHHVRLLVATEFLAPEPVRTGARGALEKPYRATRRSWTMRVSRPEDESAQVLAMLDAVRDELVESDGEVELAGGRLGMKISEERAAALAAEIGDLLARWAAEPEDPDGRPLGLFVTLHHLRR